MTFDEYMALVGQTFKQHVHDGINAWRYGQTVVNVLTMERPELADRLRNSPVDCFYNDGFVPAYLQELAQIWTD